MTDLALVLASSSSYLNRVVERKWSGNKLPLLDIYIADTLQNFKLENSPKIWSSTTLYNEDMKLERQAWFADWLQENKSFSQDKILAFHQDATKGTKETAIKMKRTFVETVSITSVLKKDTALLISYFDLLTSAVTESQMKL